MKVGAEAGESRISVGQEHASSEIDNDVVQRPATAPQAKGLRRVLKVLVFGALRFGGVAALLRHTVQRRAVTVLTYHDPAPAVLDRHLRLLTRAYNVITLTDLLDALDAGSFRGLPPRALLVTIDDGWAGNVHLMPVLTRFRVRPALFLVTSIVGTNRHFWWTECSREELPSLKRASDSDRLARLSGSGFTETREYPLRQALSLDELAVLAPHVDLQPHSRFHPVLPMCDDERARDEMVGCLAEFERLTGQRGEVLAYPNGDHSPREERLAEEAGLRAAFTLEPGSNSARTPPFALRRYSVADAGEGVSDLVISAAGIYDWLLRKGLLGRGRRAHP